jgi:hypothetical protein
MSLKNIFHRGATIFLNRIKPASGKLIFVVANFDLVIGPPASNAFMIFPPFRHQKLFSTNSIWFMLEAFKVGGQFVLTTHPVDRPAKCNEHPPQSVWSFPTSSASSLDQKFLFHAVRKDPLQVCPPRRVLLCSAFFCDPRR